tara:strand:- start:133816 stop:134583 length:768 start_codon:yes stop_codon:yes gene_type:complete
MSIGKYELTLFYFTLLFAITSASATTISTKPEHATSNIRSPQKVSEKLLAVVINGQQYPSDVEALSIDGDTHISIKDLRHWRLILPLIDDIFYFEGITYYPLNKIKGLHYHIDEAEQLLVIEADVASFEMTKVKASPSGFSVPEPSSLGGFVNYDFSLQSAPSSTQIDSLFEVGAFNRWGVGLGTFITRDLSSSRDMVRLDTSWTMDNPEKLSTITVGDAINMVVRGDDLFDLAVYNGQVIFNHNQILLRFHCQA